MSKVRLGYFADFKSNDTLLMEADTEGLQSLAALFRSLAVGTRDSLALHDLPLFEIHHGVQLTAACGGHDRGTRRFGTANSFLWERTALGWEDVADKLDSQVQAERACHHYLDAEKDEVVVQVSKGEYGDKWWLEHG